jgi:hypothetical protein
MPTPATWKTPADGDWGNAGEWDIAVVPNGDYGAVLPTAAVGYRVTIAAGEGFTVDTLALGSLASLNVGGTLTLTSGTSTIAPGGVMDGGSASNAMVSGAGTLLNQGLIAEDVAGGTLLLFDPHGALTVTNAGTMAAYGGGSLLIETPHFTNFANGTLTGGFYDVVAPGVPGPGATIGIWGSTAATASLTTLATAISLDGAGSSFVSGANGAGFRSIESTLQTIAAAGTLDLGGGRSYSASQTLAVDGALGLHGGTYAGALAIGAGGTLAGFGTVNGTITDAGRIEASGGVLALGTPFGGGVVQVDPGATLVLRGTVSAETNDGVLSSATTGTLLVQGAVSGAGGFQVQGGGTLELAGVSGPVAFNGGNAALRLDDPSSFGGVLIGLGNTDRIYLAGIQADAATSGAGVLTVTANGAPVDRIALDGDYQGAHFSVSYDGTGSLVTAAPPTQAARDYALEGQLWTQAPSRPITWSFAASTYSGDSAHPFSSFITAADEQAVIEQAFQDWSAASGLGFEELPDSATASGAADIRLGWGNLGTGSGTEQIGSTYYSYLGVGNAIAPDVLVRLEDPADVPLVPGAGGALTYQGYNATLLQVALHEIGHALGLGHSTDPDAVMYATAGASNRALDGSDMAGARALYGAALACYLRGTRIATPSGDVAIEALRPGDLVLTHRGEALPVVWIGHRRVEAARHPEPARVLPVRIRAGAFGPGLPRRDLLVSPDHAIFVHDVLIPARLLADGDAVAIDASIGSPEYFHLELERHAVLLAEGLPAESLMPGGDRAAFENGGGPVRLHPDFHALAWEAEACAPLVLAGPALDAARAWLARATGPSPADPAGRANPRRANPRRANPRTSPSSPNRPACGDRAAA